MTDTTQHDALRWVDEAEKDLQDAAMLLRHESYYPLCRLAHLAAEKALRGWLLGKGQHVSPQSTLALLGQQVEAAEPALGMLMSSLRALEPFAPPTQSPTALQGRPSSPPLYGRETAKQSLALATQAIMAAKRSLLKAG